MNENFLEQLQAELGDRCSTEAGDLEAHSRDISRHRSDPPIAVVYAHSVRDVQLLSRLCTACNVPLIPVGTATAVEGGIVPIHGGVSLDLTRMNKVREVQVADQLAVIDAGVTRLQLNECLDRDYNGNLFFPVDPGADASLGGMAATRASGSSAVRYGTMRENVLGLEVVLANGEVVTTGGRSFKSSAGYDLTRLFVGSEGTLGTITGLTLRLHQKPRAVSAAVCAMNSVQDAVNVVIAVNAAAIPMARIELLDEIQMDAVNRYSSLNYSIQPTLFFEFHGSPLSVKEDAEAVGEIVNDFGGGDFHWATTESERRRLWQARYDGYYAAKALRDGCIPFITDVCVPISCLGDCISKTKEILRSTELPAPLFGHVGDGNFHVLILIDPDSEKELKEAQRINDQIVELALQMKGTCTGEHGIGMGKIESLRKEHGNGVDVMVAIKAALDPSGIMNPGKVVAQTRN